MCERDICICLECCLLKEIIKCCFQSSKRFSVFYTIPIKTNPFLVMNWTPLSYSGCIFCNCVTWEGQRNLVLNLVHSSEDRAGMSQRAFPAGLKWSCLLILQHPPSQVPVCPSQGNQGTGREEIFVQKSHPDIDLEPSWAEGICL